MFGEMHSLHFTSLIRGNMGIRRRTEMKHMDVMHAAVLTWMRQHPIIRMNPITSVTMVAVVL
jgi:hypothetical protein